MSCRITDWCELERQKYKAYTQKEKEFPPLWENQVFQPVRNMIIREVDSISDSGEVEEEYIPEQESGEIQERVVSSPQAVCSKTVFGLLVNLSRVIKDDYDNRFAGNKISADKKLRQMIHRKKIALGIKEEHSQGGNTPTQ